MIIENMKDLQKNLIDIMDFARVHRAEIEGGNSLMENAPPKDKLYELYELGKMQGYEEAAGAIYLSVFGAKAYGELLSMLMAKGEQDE